MSTPQDPSGPPGSPSWPPAAPLGTYPPGSTPGAQSAGAYGPGAYPPYGQVPDAGPSSGSDRIGFVIVAILVGVALAFVGAWAWAQVADPPKLVIARDGAYLSGEIAYDAQVVVTLWFLVVGLVGGAVSGFVIGLIGRRHGIVAVVAVVLMTAVACGLSAWLGIHVFGPDLDAALAHAQVGDLVTAKLSISADVAYLGWPVGGLLGALAGIALWPQDPKRPQPGPMSGTVIGPSPPWGS